MLVVNTSVVVDVQSTQIIAESFNVVILMTVDIRVSGVPAYAKPRMVYKLDKLICPFGT